MRRLLFIILVTWCSLFAPDAILKFKTPDDAASHATTHLVEQLGNKLLSCEYVCAIYINQDGTYSYTKFEQGNAKRATIPVYKVPKHCKYYSSLHNHPESPYSGIPSKADLITTTIVVNDEGIVEIRGFSNGAWSYLYDSYNKSRIKYRLRPGRLVINVSPVPKRFMDYEQQKY